MPRSSLRNSSGRRNILAACVTFFCVGVLYSSFDPLPAGEDTFDFTAPQTVFEFESVSVPLPPATLATPSDQTDQAIIQEDAPAASTDQPTRPAEGSYLTNLETIKFCSLLLQDGARFMENMKDYSVNFSKEERIDGDLKPRQTIAVKVQHSPHFAVYMKWQSGERGRQVLYSSEYEDGCMVVKFGGLKRILPAIRVDPNSSPAKAESRYPVTEAGVLGMIRQIQAHREDDLKRGHGVSCVRLGDEEFDGHQCYCFLFNYDAPEFNSVYRKSILLLDSRRHIPLMIRNFTWATDAEDLSEEELDKATLIENYSFTRLNASSDLVAQDFSRENPSYRM